VKEAQKMAREFLGRGWKFPICLDEDGKIETSQFEDDIREAIGIILGTSKGERVMHPDFGCGIQDLVFATLNTSTIGMIKDSVKEALVMWEPRIDIKNIDVSIDKSNDSKVLVSIDYYVRAVNNEFNLVYPFYLKE
jgi:phage baseplate assembly protein W